MPSTSEDPVEQPQEAKERVTARQGFGFDYYHTTLDSDIYLQALAESLKVGLKRPEIDVTVCIYEDKTVLFALETPRQRKVSHSSLTREYSQSTAKPSKLTAKLWTRSEEHEPSTKYVGIQIIDAHLTTAKNIDAFTKQVFPADLELRLFRTDSIGGYIPCQTDEFLGLARQFIK